MAKVVHVQAVTRSGFSGFNRGGRFWPSGEPTEVEVVAEEKDEAGKVKPLVQEAGKPHRITEATYKELKAEPNIVIRQPGDPVENVQSFEQAQSENARLRAEIASLKGTPGPSDDGDKHGKRRQG